MWFDFCFVPYQINGTPLFVASVKGHHRVVWSLLGAGADVNVATSDVSYISLLLQIPLRKWNEGKLITTTIQSIQA